MSQPRWLEGYKGQTTDELIAFAGAYRTDSIVLAFEQGIAARVARNGAEQLTAAERVVLAVEALEREVNSGGFEGLFAVESEQVPHLASSLSAIGRDDVADLTRSAIASLGIDGPLTPDAIKAAIDEEDDDRDDPLDAYDEIYYATAGDLADPLFAYISANRAQITLP
jgi:hypothetical protein